MHRVAAAAAAISLPEIHHRRDSPVIVQRDRERESLMTPSLPIKVHSTHATSEFRSLIHSFVRHFSFLFFLFYGQVEVGNLNLKKALVAGGLRDEGKE